MYSVGNKGYAVAYKIQFILALLCLHIRSFSWTSIHVLAPHFNFPSWMLAIINVLFFPPSLDSMKYDQHWLELRKENNLTNSNQFSQDVSIFCQGHRVSGSLFICIEQMAGNKPNSDIFKTFEVGQLGSRRETQPECCCLSPLPKTCRLCLWVCGSPPTTDAPSAIII